ncbi:hypothetical protein M0R04_04580 [Candidatus Dojkabacteria bacterium]|jgi:hypothetical protein|nr:hypothetical protein [Candidatus Dojkabacteria bacterium]
MLKHDYNFGDDDTFRIYDPDYPNISFTVKIEYYGSGYRSFKVTMFFGRKYYDFMLEYDFKKLEDFCEYKMNEHGG